MLRYCMHRKINLYRLSDHFPVFISRKTNDSCGVKNTHYTISYRSFKNFDENKLIDDLKSTPWDVVKVFDDVNDIVETWSGLFCDIVDSIFLCKNTVSSENTMSNANNKQNG